MQLPGVRADCGAGAIAPGDSITVDTAALGVSLGDDQGELGLYTASDFENPEAIVACVGWGTDDHRRSSVAVAAGIRDGTPVEAGARLDATVDAPTSSAEWTSTGADSAGARGVRRRPHRGRRREDAGC